MVSVFVGDRWASVDTRKLVEVYTVNRERLCVLDCGDRVDIVLIRANDVGEVLYSIEKGDSADSISSGSYTGAKMQAVDRFCDAYFGM